MSRRKKAVRRTVPADPRYDSQTVSKFVCNLMERGKKSLAERVFYDAMDLIEQRTGQPGPCPPGMPEGEVLLLPVFRAAR